MSPKHYSFPVRTTFIFKKERKFPAVNVHDQIEIFRVKACRPLSSFNVFSGHLPHPVSGPLPFTPTIRSFFALHVMKAGLTRCPAGCTTVFFCLTFASAHMHRLNHNHRSFRSDKGMFSYHIRTVRGTWGHFSRCI